MRPPRGYVDVQVGATQLLSSTESVIKQFYGKNKKKIRWARQEVKYVCVKLATVKSYGHGCRADVQVRILQASAEPQVAAQEGVAGNESTFPHAFSGFLVRVFTFQRS